MTTLTIAAFSDIHAFTSNIYAMQKKLSDFDVIILAGDMTNGQMASLILLLKMIEAHNQIIFAVCGNHDTPEMETYLASKQMSLHARHQVHRGIAFVGCNGSLPRRGGYVFTDDEYDAILKKASHGLDRTIPRILVAHQPPYGTKLDRTWSGKHVGSHAIRSYIEREQPLVCFTGHMHEATGIDTIGKTQLINPGMVSGTNRYAYVEIVDSEVIVCERRRANPHR